MNNEVVPIPAGAGAGGVPRMFGPAWEAPQTARTGVRTQAEGSWWACVHLCNGSWAGDSGQMGRPLTGRRRVDGMDTKPAN